MVEGFWNISTHFVVSAELMMSQLCLPSIYLDTGVVSTTHDIYSCYNFSEKGQHGLSVTRTIMPFQLHVSEVACDSTF